MRSRSMIAVGAVFLLASGAARTAHADVMLGPCEVLMQGDPCKTPADKDGTCQPSPGCESGCSLDCVENGASSSTAASSGGASGGGSDGEGSEEAKESGCSVGAGALGMGGMGRFALGALAMAAAGVALLRRRESSAGR